MPGCCNLVGFNEGTYCPAHRRAGRVDRVARDRHRGSSAARGYDATWQRERLGFLARYPLCPGVLFALPSILAAFACGGAHERTEIVGQTPGPEPFERATGHRQRAIELMQAFHRLREQARERGILLIFGSTPFAAISPRMTGENCGQTPGDQQCETVLRNFLAAHPIYRVAAWDVSRPAVVVDHIIPHRGDPLLMWAEWNWQPLTKIAHDRKTATEQARGLREIRG